MMDSVVPTIPEVTIDDVERKMPHPTLTRIEGEPDYASMSIVREELTRNAIASKSTFGGGKHGHYGSITDPATYVIDAGVPWTVPAGGGLYPTFAAGMTDAQKKLEVARFVVEQTNIKRATTTEEVLKNQFLEAVPEDYYLELNVGVLRYDGSTTYELLTHVMTNYAKLDDHIVKENKKLFEEAPDLTRPIDTYFKKIEDCQKLANDGEVPISEAEMVLQLQTHIGATGLVNSRYLRWKKKPIRDRTWALAKKEFREALSDVGIINKLTTAESGLTANAVLGTSTPEDKVRAEMQRELGESFDTLACAATIKSDTMDALSKSLAEVTSANNKLTATNAELSATILKLTNQLNRASNSNNNNNNNNSNNNGRRPGRNPNNNNNNNNNYNNNNGNTDSNDWPAWCDPDAYCYTCGYKVRKGHDSGTCPKAKDNADHKSNATRQNTMGGSKLHAGFGNRPNGK